MAMPESNFEAAEERKDEPVSHVITLIHGTFAKNAHWTVDNSPLCQALRVHLSPGLIIRRFPWSGANRNLDRIRASRQLAGILHEDIRRYPDAAHFIIAHSHGGNVALYALKDPSLQSKLSGIICMNTPFITATRRNVEQVFFGLRALLIFLYVGFTALVLTEIVLTRMEDIKDFLTKIQDIKEFANLLWLLIVISGFIALWIWFFAGTINDVKRIKDWFIRWCEEIIINLSLPRISAAKVLCIWSAGDEVFSVFNTLEGLSNIPFLMLNVYFIVLLFAAALGWSFFTPEVSDLYRSGVEGWIIGYVLVAALLLIILILVMAVAVFLNFLVRIVLMGLSWRLLVSSLFVRLSFTYTPLMAQQVQFYDLALGLSFLNHSKTYQQPEALNMITDWLRGKSIVQRRW